MSINSQPDSVVTAIDTEGHTAPPIFKLVVDEYGFIKLILKLLHLMLLRYESAKSLKRITPKKNDYMEKLIYKK